MDHVLAVLSSLRNHVEYTQGEWGMVYLDNARPKNLSEATFRACLASLSKRGLYQVVDGFAWGKVKVQS